MRICTKHNLTVSFMAAPENQYGYFDWREKRAKGFFAKTMLNDFFLMKKYETQDDIFKYCNFLPCEEIGQLLENGSYDGAIGEIINFRADFSINPQNMFISPNLVDVTDVSMADYISVGHLIDTNDQKQNLLNYVVKLKEIFAPSFYFFLEYSSLILFSFIFILILNLISKKISNLKFRSSELIFSMINQQIQIVKKSNFMVLFFLFFSIYLFFIRELLSSSLNTNHIIVDIDQLIYSKEKIYQTKKEVCFFTKTKEIDYYKNSLNNSLAHFMFYEKINKSEPCFLVDYIPSNELIAKNFSKNGFLFSYSTNLEILKVFNSFFKKDIFISKNPYLSENAVFYLSKKINKLAKIEMNYYSSLLLRQGFDKKIVRETKLHNRKLFVQYNQTFYSTSEYVDHYTFTEQLKLKDLPYIYLHCLFLILILICFLIDYILYTKYLILNLINGFNLKIRLYFNLRSLKLVFNYYMSKLRNQIKKKIRSNKKIIDK